MGWSVAKHLHGSLSSRMLPVQLPWSLRGGLVQVSEQRCARPDCIFAPSRGVCGGASYLLLAWNIFHSLCPCGTGLHYAKHIIKNFPEGSSWRIKCLWNRSQVTSSTRNQTILLWMRGNLEVKVSHIEMDWNYWRLVITRKAGNQRMNSNSSKETRRTKMFHVALIWRFRSLGRVLHTSSQTALPDSLLSVML